MSVNKLPGTKKPTDQNQLPSPSWKTGSATPAGVFTDELHENLLKQKGFRAIHYRHALNPNRETVEAGVDLSQRTDIAAFNLYDPRPFFIVPQQLSWNDQYLIQGVHGAHSYMVVNHTGNYDTQGKERVYLRHGDVIVLEDSTTVLVTELAEFKPTGLQRLRFPIIKIDYIADKNGTRFEEGVHFEIVNNMIQWNQTNEMWNSMKGRGVVLSVVYWTVPHFQVTATPRIFRTVWSNAPGNPNQTAQATYLPGSAVLKMLWEEQGAGFDLPDWPSFLDPNRTHNTQGG